MLVVIGEKVVILTLGLANIYIGNINLIVQERL